MFKTGAKLFVGVLLFALGSCFAISWDIECVDCPREFRALSIGSFKIDGNGNPHIAYGWREVWHAWHDGITWHYEIVDETDAMGYEGIALELDENGYPHMAYRGNSCTYSHHPLKYAFWDGSEWQIELLDWGEFGSYIFDISLALDLTGHPHIAYRYEWYDQDSYGSELRYSNWDGVTWHSEILDNFISGTSIATDSSGYPHILYSCSDTLKYTYFDGDQWHRSIADDNAGSHFCSLDLDVSGHSHLSYLDEPTQCIVYGVGEAPLWEFEVVDSTSTLALYPSLAVDTFSMPHISFIDRDPDCVKYAKRNVSGWQIEIVDSLVYAGWLTSLALSSSAQPNVAYLHQGYHQELKMASRGDLVWENEVIDRTAIAYEPSLSLDSSDMPHVAYVEGYRNDLKYARRVEGEWHKTTVDSIGNVGSSLSLEVDSGGYPHICYLDWFNVSECALKYAYFNGLAWTYSIIDESTNTLDNASLAVSNVGAPCISYQDSDPAEVLMYASMAGSGWEVTVVDANGSTGRGSSLALDESGDPHISYYACSPDPELRYAHKCGTEWHIVPVDTECLVDYSSSCTSLVLDGAGHPHIAYSRAYPYYDLKYAYSDGTAWYTEPVDVVGALGRNPAIALDSTGHPHIVYEEIIINRVRYAFRDGSGWRIETISDERYRRPQLALDPFDNAYVVVEDIRFHDIKMASGQPLAIVDLPTGMPAVISIASIYPNPTARRALVRYELSHAMETTLCIFDMSGQMVRSIENGKLPRGQHFVLWDGKDNRGHPVSSGPYVCLVNGGRFHDSGFVVLAR